MGREVWGVGDEVDTTPTGVLGGVTRERDVGVSVGGTTDSSRAHTAGPAALSGSTTSTADVTTGWMISHDIT